MDGDIRNRLREPLEPSYIGKVEHPERDAKAPVNQALNQLQERVMSLDDLASSLLRRLEPVLRPEDKTRAGTDSDGPYGSLVHNQIQETTKRIEVIYYRIMEILDRLEV